MGISFIFSFAFPFQVCKMAEQKDVCSSSPARTPKLQLATEQLLTGKILPPKRYPRPRAKEKPQKDGRRGEIQFKIKPHTWQRHSDGSNKTLCTQEDPRETEPVLPLNV